MQTPPFSVSHNADTLAGDRTRCVKNTAMNVYVAQWAGRSSFVSVRERWNNWLALHQLFICVILFMKCAVIFLVSTNAKYNNSYSCRSECRPVQIQITLSLFLSNYKHTETFWSVTSCCYVVTGAIKQNPQWSYSFSQDLHSYLLNKNLCLKTFWLHFTAQSDKEFSCTQTNNYDIFFDDVSFLFLIFP